MFSTGEKMTAFNCRSDQKDRTEFTTGPQPRPLIGVVGCLVDNGASQFIRRNYMQAIQDAGGIPVILGMVPSDEMLPELLGRLDGLVLSGGPDIDPGYYGREPIPELGEITPERDEMEMNLIHRFHAMNKPILGICRGMQALAVAFGATLYQDLPTQYPSHIDHDPNKENRDVRDAHLVHVQKGTRLEAISGPGEWFVNSYHHQAVETVPEGMRLAAVSPDGIIEAIEVPEGTLCLGVQWHPERICDTDEHASALFRALVDSARACMTDQGKP